jgi:hypothetical protein
MRVPTLEVEGVGAIVEQAGELGHEDGSAMGMSWCPTSNIRPGGWRSHRWVRQQPYIPAKWVYDVKRGALQGRGSPTQGAHCCQGLAVR